MLLLELGIEVASHVIRVGRAEMDAPAAWEEIARCGRRTKCC